MAPRFYSQRHGDYVYDVTVTEDDTVQLSTALSRPSQQRATLGRGAAGVRSSQSA
jgi:hypothetical protein